jgi:hypothetical protein
LPGRLTCPDRDIRNVPLSSLSLNPEYFSAPIDKTWGRLETVSTLLTMVGIM